uniref:Uncharacterized protein n=1 Tax=Caenorhabditis japonica TaxID=281687 RepID=A0A8R1EP26_CAEJA
MFMRFSSLLFVAITIVFFSSFPASDAQISTEIVSAPGGVNLTCNTAQDCVHPLMTNEISKCVDGKCKWFLRD